VTRRICCKKKFKFVGSDQKNLLQEKSEFCGDQKILGCKQENPSLQAPSLWCGKQNPFARSEFCGVASKIRLRDPSLISFVVTTSFDANKIRVCQDPIFC
jgi:hypothetical protein